MRSQKPFYIKSWNCLYSYILCFEYLHSKRLTSWLGYELCRPRGWFLSIILSVPGTVLAIRFILCAPKTGNGRVKGRENRFSSCKGSLRESLTEPGLEILFAVSWSSLLPVPVFQTLRNWTRTSWFWFPISKACHIWGRCLPWHLL